MQDGTDRLHCHLVLALEVGRGDSVHDQAVAVGLGRRPEEGDLGSPRQVGQAPGAGPSGQGIAGPPHGDGHRMRATVVVDCHQVRSQPKGIQLLAESVQADVHTHAAILERTVSPVQV